jgi:hypothetical protein
MIKNMGMESLAGVMENSTKANGKMENKYIK